MHTLPASSCRQQWRRIVTTAIVCIALIGCGSEKPDTPAATVTRLQPGTGVIRGGVKFGGTKPVPALLENEPCHDAAQPIYDETVVVNDDDTLANVLVYLKDVASDAPAAPTTRPVLDQVNCRYVPHVLGVQVGQELIVRSSDPTLHNVHYDPANNKPANFGMTTAGAERVIAFDRDEVAVRVRCDVHPWMTAYIAVLDHPWFAVTGGTGSFEITNLPAGSFILVAWHERYGRIEKQVTVDPAHPVDVEFEYRAPD
jgi:hypothetical protein